MKKLLLIFLLANFISNGQSMFTIGEVYDFNINDEFQSRITTVPSNAARIKIIGKRFSANNDTVFYVRSYNNYSSVVSYVPSPHLVYTHNSGIDSVYYTNLDTLINAQFRNMANDSCNSSKDSIYSSSQFCTTVYEHTACVACCFEGQTYDQVYGKGLGLLSYDYNYPSNFYNTHTELFYYKKGPVSCGIPDSSHVLSVTENMQVKQKTLFYPNPAINMVHLTNISHPTTISLYDILGTLVMETKVTGNETLDVSKLAPGIYTLVANDGLSMNSYKMEILKE